jgi:hypothetical protein
LTAILVKHHGLGENIHVRKDIIDNINKSIPESMKLDTDYPDTTEIINFLSYADKKNLKILQ